MSRGIPEIGGSELEERHPACLSEPGAQPLQPSTCVEHAPHLVSQELGLGVKFSCGEDLQMSLNQ